MLQRTCLQSEVVLKARGEANANIYQEDVNSSGIGTILPLDSKITNVTLSATHPCYPKGRLVILP